MGNNGQKWFSPAKTILLTGAGFTHNFGGYLASGMWALILNHPGIRKYPKLRGLMLEEMNYESIYDEVLTKQEYDNGPERDALQEAIRNAYQQLHEAICLDDNRRKLPRQEDSPKVELLAVKSFSLYSVGVSLPNESCDLSSL